jgi:hypothetical protein
MQGVERSLERVSATAEVFTPSKLVVEILQYLDLGLFAPGKLVLDPACGDGQFLVAAKWIKVYKFRMSEEEALLEIYGVDIMRDNVLLCKSRLGGGNIVMGNSLLPREKLKGQTKSEYETLNEWFAHSSLDLANHFPTRKRVAKASSGDTLF